MAKVSFAKLGLKVNQDVNIVEYNEQTIEVKQYLPLADKLVMMTDIVNDSIDDNGYYNPVRLDVYMTLGLIETYSNINITPKMKEDPFKLYDLFLSSGFADIVLNAMDPTELNTVRKDIMRTMENIYNYRNSLAGVINMVVSDYDNVNLDASTIQQSLSDPNNLTLLKDIMTKLG